MNAGAVRRGPESRVLANGPNSAGDKQDLEDKRNSLNGFVDVVRHEQQTRNFERRTVDGKLELLEHDPLSLEHDQLLLERGQLSVERGRLSIGRGQVPGIAIEEEEGEQEEAVLFDLEAGKDLGSVIYRRRRLKSTKTKPLPNFLFPFVAMSPAMGEAYT